MHVAVRKGNVDLTEELRAAVHEKVGRVGRFLEGMERAEVHFLEERNPRISERDVCEVTLHGHGHVVRAKAAGHEPMVALDRVVDKLEHRMEKLKGKLVGRSHPRHRASVQSGPIAQPADDDEVLDGEPRIVKSKKFAMKPMTPEEAALQMELVGHEFYFFANVETGESAVVYRRRDGQIGLIDPT